MILMDPARLRCLPEAMNAHIVTRNLSTLPQCDCVFGGRDRSDVHAVVSALQQARDRGTPDQAHRGLFPAHVIAADRARGIR